MRALLLIFLLSNCAPKYTYHEHGVLREQGRLDGKIKSGYWKYYYENGLLQREGKYKKDIPTGAWKFYYENGLLESNGHFVPDSTSNTGYSKDGLWIYYTESGLFKCEEQWREGKLISTNC